MMGAIKNILSSRRRSGSLQGKHIVPALRQDDKVLELGNALIFILIAIALLGVLTVSLSRSGDSSNDSGSYERQQIVASEILAYAKSMENAVQSLLARGCSENEISFWDDSDGNDTEDGSDNYYNASSPTDHSCHVFDVAGAGISNEISTSIITATYALTDIETARAELLLILEDQDEALCTQINRIASAPVINDDYDTVSAAFTGAYPATDSLGNSGEIDGALSACFEDSDDSRQIFYHVLISR